VLAVTEEDYVPNCEGQGRFHTFDATGSVAKGEPLQLLDTFKLAEGTLDPVAGERALGTVFCSAHWFTVRDNIVAIGWYGAGTRFLDISDPRDIRQVGYAVSVDQETWASYWVPGSNIVYSVDSSGGSTCCGSPRSPTASSTRPRRPSGPRRASSPRTRRC
jgi:hypothetical protein